MQLNEYPCLWEPSNFESRNQRNGANTNLGNIFLFFKRTLSASISFSHLLSINALKLALIFSPKLFLYLGVNSSSEDDEEVPLLSFYFWNDLVLLPAVKFRIPAYGYCLFTRIYEWEQPNKNSGDNYEDRGFWDSN